MKGIVKIKEDGKQVLAVNVSENLYADIYGCLRKCSPEDVSRTRNVPEEARACFKKMAQLYASRKKMEAAFEDYKKQYTEDFSQLSYEIYSAAEKIRETYGILSKKEFEIEFLKNVPAAAMEEIKKTGFRMDAPDGIGYRDDFLYLSYHQMIDHYIRSIPPYVYQEYDGNLFICDEPEKYPEYKKHLKAYGKKLACVSPKVNFYEKICTGGRLSIYYSCCYEFGLPETLTKDAARELAKKSFIQKVRV